MSPPSNSLTSLFHQSKIMFQVSWYTNGPIMTDSHEWLGFACECLCKCVCSITQENARFDTRRSRFILPSCHSWGQQHQDVTDPDKLNWKIGVRKKAPIVHRHDGKPRDWRGGEQEEKVRPRTQRGVFKRWSLSSRGELKEFDLNKLPCVWHMWKGADSDALPLTSRAWSK